MVRYGIVGFGLHAAKRLMPGIAAASNSTVLALSRRNLAHAQRTADEFGVALAFDTAEALCASDQIDAVFIASPNALHLNDVLTAVRHRKPVICEKPLGLTADECRIMISAARNSGVLLGVAQCFRFSPVLNAVKQKIQAGAIGAPVFARTEFSFMGVGHARRWIANRQIAGGGPIMDIGVHCVDLLRFVLADEVDRIAAVEQSDADSNDVEASALLNLNFARGTLATVAVSMRAPYHTAVEITGTAGTIRAQNALVLEGAVALEVVRDGRVLEREEHSNAGLFARQFDTFSEAVEQGTDFNVPGEEGLQNARVLDAAYRSIETGTIQSLGRE